MSIEMTMNFNHMAPWNAAYADLRLAEQNIKKATKEEKLLAMKSMRSAFEKMVTALAEHAGITDEVVMQLKRQMNKEDSRADLYGRILALCAYKVIDSQSANNYNTIRMLGNHAVHDCEGPYKLADLQKVSKDAEIMFRLLHKESNLFANKYMMAESVVTARTVAMRPTKRRGWFALGFVAVACVALYFLFLFSAMERQQRNHEKNAQRMYEDYQENVERNQEEYEQAVADMYEEQQERTQTLQRETKERHQAAAQEVQEIYEESAKEMQERYEQSVQEMQAQYEENVRRMRGY